MNKAIVYMFLFMAFNFYSKAQNFVPNYSFEDTIKCIGGGNQFSGYVTDWVGGASGLCYFTSECEEAEDSVPLNWFGRRYAHTGHAYAGIYTYVNDTCRTCPSTSKNLRDYIQDKLLDSLKAFVKYYITFYVSPADTSWYYCNNIGAYFSDSSLYYPSYIVYAKSYLTPQIENNPITNPLTKGGTWIKVSGSFIAQGGEKYIIIGNFNDDSTSSIVFRKEFSPTEPDAFYYIDDVIVSPDSNYADSLEGINQLGIRNYELKVFPNPGNGIFNFEC